MQVGIAGAWKLRSYVMENVDTKQRSEPFGSAPRGSLILLPKGRLTVLITAGGQSVSPPGRPRIVAYSGRYRLEPPDRLVTSVDVSWFEAWLGTEQARTYKLDGDKLDLFTPPGPMPQPGGGDAMVFAALSWAREPAP